LKPYRAASRFVETVEQAQERRLPCAAWSDDHQNFPCTYIDSHIIDDARTFDLTGEMVGLEDSRRWRETLLLRFLLTAGLS
jgi:hypothetical protein